MTPETLLRAMAVVVPAVLGALLLDVVCAARGLLPPGFRIPWRRALADLTVALLLAVAVFAPLGSLGMKASTEDLSSISTPQLFLLHVLMVITMGVWFLLGFAGAGARPVPPPEPAMPLHWPELVEPAGEAVFAPPPPPRVPLGRQFMAQFGYLAPSIPREIGLGVMLGIGAWVAVIVALMVIAGVVLALGGQNAIPKSPPALIPLIAGLPIWVRFLVSLSAGVVEESFFRGFLQPRIGILASTGFFVLAHLSYGQPFMLVGIALLSLIYAFLVRWRQNVWPAMAAHALFDGVQLLVVVPAALRMLGAEKGAAFLW
ncbi:MAG TPA: CPBP family intramembrane glutamic endopeptidase [Thermoanaerobaculia bacterium]|nr:CPBP family intramembrane glutamic endopeptidase [Thermoanaerobaculia bacterium]